MREEQISRDRVEIAPLKYPVHAYAQQLGDILPGLPILTTTRLQLELLLNDPVVDLKAVTEVILADAGATLQILRVVGREFEDMDSKPARIEDCIVSLSAARCHQVICAPHEAQAEAYTKKWHYYRRRAECMRELAKDREDFAPEEAYLVGLLCGLGAIPQLLGWSISASTSGEHDALGVMLAFHWNLPDYIVTAIKELHDQAQTTKWREILRLADELTQTQIG